MAVQVAALADAGAVHLCVPEHLAIQLDLAELEQREVSWLMVVVARCLMWAQ